MALSLVSLLLPARPASTRGGPRQLSAAPLATRSPKGTRAPDGFCVLSEEAEDTSASSRCRDHRLFIRSKPPVPWTERCTKRGRRPLLPHAPWPPGRNLPSPHHPKASPSPSRAHEAFGWKTGCSWGAAGPPPLPQPGDLLRTSAVPSSIVDDFLL